MMTKTLVLFLAVLAIALGSGVSPSSRAHAQAVEADKTGDEALAPPPRSIFAARDIVLDINASSSAAARNQAIAQARRIAFSSVYKRLVAREDQTLEPALTNAELARLVSAVDIRGEKSSATRYAAILSVTFDKEALIALLEDLGVTYTDAETPPILLLPIAHFGGVDMLWSRDNVWQTAWLDSTTRAQSLVRYDISDARLARTWKINGANARHVTPETAIRFIRAHQATDIVFAYADIAFDLETRRYSATIDVRRGPQQSRFIQFTMQQNEEENPAALLERAIAQVDSELSALWKRQLLVEYAQAQDVDIKAQFSDAQQWSTILNALSNARRLRDVSVETLHITSADLSARFFGEFNALSDALASAGVYVSTRSPTQWAARVLRGQDGLQSLKFGAGGATDDYVDPLKAGLEASRNTQPEGASAQDLNEPPMETGEQMSIPPGPRFDDDGVDAKAMDTPQAEGGTP